MADADEEEEEEEVEEEKETEGAVADDADTAANEDDVDTAAMAETSSAEVVKVARDGAVESPSIRYYTR